MIDAKRFIAVALTIAFSPSVFAKDRPDPPLPCPLTATLRIADPASLAGITGLDGCSADRIVATPATPAEYLPPRTKRIVPDSDFDRASPRATMASVVRIAPDRPEAPTAPAALAAAATTSPDVILNLRPVSFRTPYDAIIGATAQRHRIDPLLLHAVIDRESRYRANAVSPVGARGLMQLMPGTARGLGIGLSSIAVADVNIDGGARYLRQLYGQFNDIPLTLAAYNAGPGAVRRYGNQIPPFAETQHYVRAVLGRYAQLASEAQATAR